MQRVMKTEFGEFSAYRWFGIRAELYGPKGSCNFFFYLHPDTRSLGLEFAFLLLPLNIFHLMSEFLFHL